MTPDDFRPFSFFLIALAIVLSPGPDTILILRNALAAGRRAGIITLAGVQCGVAAHTAFAAAGLAAILYHSESLFKLIAVIGGIYLAFLGAQTLRSPAAGFSIGGDNMPEDIFAQKSPGYFRQGMLCNLLNPKVIILFAALMPNFIDAESSSRNWQLIYLGLIVLAINIPYQTGVVLTAERMRRLLSRREFALMMRIILGGILLLFAAIFLWEHAINFGKEK